MKYLVAIVGPTAVGKSKLALGLAQDFPAEIISADSRQVYRYMDIGTNKPTLAERALVPHHLIDVVNPDKNFSLAMYCQLANKGIETVQRKGKLPLLVGGSGLYVWSILEGWKVPPVPPNPQLRRDLESRAKREDSYVLYEELQRIDPIAAAKIDPANTRRIIRALEIYHMTRCPPSQFWYKEAPNFSILIIGLTMERKELYRKIDYRVDEMIQKGLVEETEGLVGKGYSLSLPSVSGIGYKQVRDFLQGKMGLSAAIDKMKYETHRLARHQYAWFHPSDARIHWLDADKVSYSVILSKAKGLVESFLS
jgi:tRNA dimethylallyltransferase